MISVTSGRCRGDLGSREEGKVSREAEELLGGVGGKVKTGRTGRTVGQLDKNKQESEKCRGQREQTVTGCVLSRR